jgi:hypothetical protein
VGHIEFLQSSPSNKKGGGQCFWIFALIFGVVGTTLTWDNSKFLQTQLMAIPDNLLGLGFQKPMFCHKFILVLHIFSSLDCLAQPKIKKYATTNDV